MAGDGGHAGGPAGEPGIAVPADERYEASLRALEARVPSRMVPDLDRITTLCELLGRPDQAYPAVRITGTNGKTSVAAMVTSLLGALGLTAGTYTSPHLQDVRERIRVAGEPISPEDVVAGLSYLELFLAEVDARLPDPVTYFEVLTALAYVHFADAPADAAVLEVGMGGRW
ncbi:MAG: dihydrofolate synthase, partial [Actinobacteria bacterium]|nr:dihydrofolate synthase [Actinomycetota bacterium]